MFLQETNYTAVYAKIAHTHINMLPSADLHNKLTYEKVNKVDLEYYNTPACMGVINKS